MKRSILLVCLVTGFLHTAAWGQTRLLRFPDLHGDRVVFTYGGDLWTASVAGGTATRVTSHPGLELFAHFSPDGKQLAFTGQYDGDEQVYVVPAEGGAPRQLSFYPALGPLPDRWGYDNQVYGWTPDGKAVLFRSGRHGWTLTDTRLYTASLDGGLPEPLPMPVSGGGDLSPDGKKVVYSPLTRDFRTWKRYAGGWAQDLYIFDLETLTQRQITEHVRTERDPMWIDKNRIYFASDRSGTLNLYEFNVRSNKIRQVTRSTKFDVRWPNRGDGHRIVYEMGGELHILDVKTGQSRKISIRVPTDSLAVRPRHTSVADNLEGFGLSPQGKRAVLVARGDVFTVPAEKGPTRNLTRSSGAHDKWATWSPDGSQIAFVSDRDGEEEVYLIDQLGRDEPRQLTDGGHGMRYPPAWSPDGKRLALTDKDGRLQVLTVADQSVVDVVDAARGQISDHTWSPQGGHLAFSMSDENGYSSIYIWSVASGKLTRVTGDMFNEFEPVWDPDGNYLFYLSDRQFAPQIGSVEWNYVLDRETGVFALSLRRDVPHPFPAESDEAKVEKKAEDGGQDDAKADKKDSAAAEKPAEAQAGGDKAPTKTEAKSSDDYLAIDFDGLDQRVTRVPVPDDNYRGLTAVKDHLIYVRATPFYYGRSADNPPAIMIFSIKSRSASVLVDGAAGYTLSHDNKKMLVSQRGQLKMLDVRPGAGSAAKPVSTSGLVADIDPREEWEQIFDEVWRRFRDFFYVKNMHGYDWEALREQYRPLLQHVAHRSDLNYLIGEMIGELNVGHAYNSGGDWEQPSRAPVGLPGAVLELDRQAGRYRIARIYSGHNEEPTFRAPLTEIGVDVREGDYILEINGRSLEASDNPYELLRHAAGDPVELVVNDKPQADGARTTSYRPLTSESDLVYLNWVAANRERVAKATSGRVGYLHLPNMGAEGIREFNKWFYGQIRREGLIIDVRNNGGGNVSQMVINRLTRELLATGFARTSETPTTYPRTVFHGHLVCLLNENSASDGDIFPAMFREAGLGPLIGKRSWGGVIGITNRGTLIDGGTVNVPEFGFASRDGKWIIEGYGVDPDIEVENDPKSIIEGRDPQLERAIKEVIERMAAEPRRLPNRPPDPIKTQ